MERLQKIISQAGAASRREAERLILAGRVALNGGTVTELGVRAEPGKDEIAIDGKLLKQYVPKLYFLLNKPRGYISAVKDNRGRKTVVDLLNDVDEYIYPVGRLDYDTEGLLLLTNDGELMNGLLHPRYEIKKTYEAKVLGVLSDSDIRRLQKGILLEDGITAPADAGLVEKAEDNSTSTVKLTIHEGRNRQVRRMLQAVGHRVLDLKRTVFAGLVLSGVRTGSYRRLTTDEIAGLKKLAGIEGQRRPQANE